MKFNETKSQERLINLMLQAGVEWPEGYNFLVQGGESGRILFYIYKPVRDGEKHWKGKVFDKDCNSKYIVDIGCNPLPNWHQTIITREMWEARDGWMTWHGGECPIPDDVPYEIMERCGEVTRKNGKASRHGSMWTNDNDEFDIVAYRIHKPAEVEQSEPCKSVQRAIPVEPTINELIAVWCADEAAIQTATDKAAKSREAVEAALARAGWINNVTDNESAMLNIVNWRDLKVGDIIHCLPDTDTEAWLTDGFENVVALVVSKEDDDYDGRHPIEVKKLDSDEESWGGPFKFIRRPR